MLAQSIRERIKIGTRVWAAYVLGSTVAPADRAVAFEWFSAWRKHGINPHLVQGRDGQWYTLFAKLRQEYIDAKKQLAIDDVENKRTQQHKEITQLVEEMECFVVPETRHYSSYYDFQTALRQVILVATKRKKLKGEIEHLYKYHEDDYTLPQLLLRLLGNSCRQGLRTIAQSIKRLNLGAIHDGHLFFSPTPAFNARKFVRLERKLTKQNASKYKRNNKF